MDEVFSMLNGIRPMSDALCERLQSIIVFETINKKKHLLEIGRTCRRVTFIIKGLFRCYYIDEDGNEFCSWFMREGDVIVAVYSFYSQTQSFEGIQALEESLVCSISHDELEGLYRDFPEFEHHGRILTQKYNMLFDKEKYLLRMNKPPMERYEHLLKEFPDVVSRVSKKDIASYLGVPRWGLSR